MPALDVRKSTMSTSRVKNAAKSGKAFVYARTRRGSGMEEIGWNNVCAELSGRVFAANSLPSVVREAIEASDNRVINAGYQVLTPDSHPGFLGQGEFLLWPVNEPFPAQTVKGRVAGRGRCGKKHEKDVSCTKGEAFPSLSLESSSNVPFPPPEQATFRFVDLFAGVGGFRIAMQTVGGTCVFSSEWDRDAQKTYCMNFGELPWGDICAINAKCIPDHDVLCAGFPCQPFSLAGVSARTAINRPSGFECQTQGTLFFEIMRIVREKRPRVLFLENVKNLVNHDKGRTFKVIKDSIEAEGYSFRPQIIDASSKVPQKRMRCYMVCVRDNGAFVFPEFSGEEIPLRSILEKRVDARYTLSDRLWAGHQKRTQRNLGRGAGFTAFCADVNKPAHTLVARYYKDGKECLVPQHGKNPRMLTPRECARLQGFPESFLLPDSRSVAYKQMGNSVAVPVITEIARKIVETL